MKKTTLLPARTTSVCNLNAARRACLWAVLGLLATLAFAPPPAQAAVTEAWVHRYNNVVSNANDQAVKVVRDAAGDIVVTGSTDGGITGKDMLTIKYSGADGAVLWQKRYSGPADSDDRAQALAVDGSGNVLVTGTSSGINYDRDYYTAKYAAADGALLWEKRYNGPQNGDDSATAMALDGSNNVVVTGSSYDTNFYTDYYTAKYAAADGALLWEKRYNGPATSFDFAYAVAVDASGNVVVTGNSDEDYYTAKYAAADGALLWEKRYNGPANGSDRATAVAVDASGNVVVTGHSWDGSNYDYYTAKYAAADGALLWEQRYGPAIAFDVFVYDFYVAPVVVDHSGNVVLTGSSSGGGGADYYTAKYAAADGALLWEKRYNGPANSGDHAYAVAVDGGGNVVVTGFSYGTNFYTDYYTAKYTAADGALLWEKRYNGPANRHDLANAVAVDGSGNVVVTGSSDNGTNSDYYTAKYAAADGALLWEQRYNGPTSYYDQASAVAVDGSGNVAVTGLSYNGPDYDYYTTKYAAADGALLWEKRGPGGSAWAVAVDGSGNVVVAGYFIGSGVNLDYYTAKYAAADGALLWEKRGPGGDASAVAVDGSGNVVVAGTSYNGTNGDYYTAKYAAADGALLWENRYNGPANNDDRANAVAVDDGGNVVVTGYSGSGGYFYQYGYPVPLSDYYTAKYAAADGALLWDKRYNGPANHDDRANAVAMDGSGNVVVTGYSSNGTNYDYYTAKYAAADGALLWDKRYNGPAKGDDYARTVAVDGSGNVVVTGDSGTIKYLANGTEVWTNIAGATALAVDGSGNVVVAGSSYNGTNSDYYTAKYAGADGALLWEKRYNGPANGDDSASSLALGPNGMVAVTGSSSDDYATVVYWENLPPVSIDLVPTGIRLRFTGVPGRSYTIERAPAVTGPWSTLATPTALPGGLIEYVDTSPPAGTAYYRTSAP